MSLLPAVQLESTPKGDSSKKKTSHSSSALQKENISSSPCRSSPSRSGRAILESSPIARVLDLTPKERIRKARSVGFSDLAFGSPIARSSPKHRRFQPYRRPAPSRIDPTDPNQLLRKPQFLAYPTPQSLGGPRSILKPTGVAINLAQTLVEGTKYNSGPRRHSISLPNLSHPMPASAVQHNLQGLTDLAEVLRAPLSTLETSLKPAISSIFLPQPIVSIVPRDVEQAYAILTTRLQAWASHVGPTAQEPASKVMIAAASTIVTCLKRDIAAVVKSELSAVQSQVDSSMASSSPTDTVAALRKQGKSEEEIRNVRVRIDVAQAAVKLAGILFHFRAFYSAFQNVEIQAILDLILLVPHTPLVRQPKDREIVAFSMWVLTAQELPIVIMQASASSIIRSIMAILDTTAAKPSKKARRANLEALLAVQNLSCQHPRLFTAFNESKQLYWILNAFQAEALQTRLRACAALGGLALGLTHAWPADAQSQIARAQSRESLSAFSSAYFTCGEGPRKSEQMVYLKAQLETRKKKPEEMPWILGMLALLPIMTGHRFKKLQEQGPQMWMEYMQLCAVHPSESIRTMHFFVWNHLFYSWLLAGGRHRASVYALEDQPFALISQSVRNVKWLQKNRTAPGSAEWTRNYQLTGQLVVSLLYGLAGFTHQHFTSATSGVLDLAQAGPWFTKLWDEVVHKDLVKLVSNCTVEDVNITAWRCFSAILAAESDTQERWREERLIYVDLLDGQALSPLAPDATQKLCNEMLRTAIAPEEITGMPQCWIASNLDKVLATFELMLPLAQDFSYLLGGEHTSPMLQAWFRILAAVRDAGQHKIELADTLHTWLVRVCTADSESSSSHSIDFQQWCLLHFSVLAGSVLKQYTSRFRDTEEQAKNSTADRQIEGLMKELRAATSLVIVDSSFVVRATENYAHVPSSKQEEYSELLSTLWSRFWLQCEHEASQPDAVIAACASHLASCLSSHVLLLHAQTIINGMANIPVAVYLKALDATCKQWVESYTSFSPSAVRLLIHSHASRACSPTAGITRLCNIINAAALPSDLFIKVKEMLSAICSAMQKSPVDIRQGWLDAFQSIFVPWFAKAFTMQASDQATCLSFYGDVLCCIRSVLENRHLDTSVLQHWQDLLLSATDTSAGAVSFALLWNDLFAPLASELQLSDHFRAVLHAISSAHPDLGVEPLSIQDSLEITMNESGHLSESSQSQSIPAPSGAAPSHDTSHHYSADISKQASFEPSPSFSAARPELAELTPSMSQKRTRNVEQQMEANSASKKIKRTRVASITKPPQPLHDPMCTPPRSARRSQRRPQSQPTARKAISPTSSFECVEIPVLDNIPPPSKTRCSLAKRDQLKRSRSEGDSTNSQFSAVLPKEGLFSGAQATPKPPACSTSSLKVPTSHKQISMEGSSQAQAENIRQALSALDEPTKTFIQGLSVEKFGMLLTAGIAGLFGQ